MNGTPLAGTPAAMREAAGLALATSRYRLSRDHPFFACLLLMSEVLLVDDIDTACTDGMRIKFNPAFVKSLPARELDGVMVHEVLHCALMHVPRCGARDPCLWNIAADIQVNGKIASISGLALPAGCVFRPDLATLRVEDIYEVLEREQRGCSASACAVMKDIEAACGRPVAPRGCGATKDDGAKSTACATPMHAQELEKHWTNALQMARQHAESRGCGYDPMSGRPYAEAERARADWRTELWRHVVTSPDDFTGFDRRLLSRGIYAETLECESVDVEVCIDTSGSIYGSILDLFVGELAAIMDSHPFVRCRLRWCDTQCSPAVELRRGMPLPPATGGGGTDFQPFFRELERGSPGRASSRTLAVYFTDGYGAFPKEPPRDHHVLWVVPPGALPATAFPFGEVLKLG